MLRIASSQRAALRNLAISQRIARANGLHSSAIANALQAFAMPAMSPTMTEGGIASWKKQEGDTFSAGDVLIEIETDKATMDVEAQEDGFLAKIIVQGGSKNVQVGSAIAVIGEEGDEVTDAEVEKIVKSAESQEASKESNQEEEAAATKEESKKTEEPKKEEPKKEETKKEEPKEEESKPAPSKSESSSQPKDRDIIFASPVAKRLASEKGIPLTALKGTGPNGRIIKEDVDNYKPSGGAAASGSSAPPAGTKLPPGSPAAKDMSVPASYTDIPVSNMRRIIGQRLTESKQSTPHYYTTIEIKMDRVNQLRELFNKAAAGAEKGKKDGVPSGMKLSVNDFILKACAIALKEVPEANSAWMGDIVRQYHKADICVAVATPTGLITPIVTDVGGKGLADISATVKTLATKARDGKLAPNEYQGGSFTVSNLGMFGIEHFTAIINPPQSCILAIGASEQKLVLDESSEKGFKAVNVMKVTLSADHRIVDGAVGARWLNAFRDALENPLSFLL